MALMLLPSSWLSSLIEVLTKADLVSARDVWFLRLSRSTRIVVVGLFLELPELAYEIGFIIRATIERWKLHITFPERHAPDLVRVVAFIGWFLIVGGVVGEWYTELKVNEADVGIEDLNDAQVTAAQKEAGDAQTSAKGAADAASRANGEAARAKASADAADAKAGKAQTNAEAAGVAAGNAAKQAAELQRDLSTAKIQLDAVEAKRAELEKSLINLAICSAPRVLGNWFIGREKSSVDLLKPFAGYKALIEFVSNDAETRRAALQIADSLKGAGWNLTKEPTPVDASVNIRDGVEVQPYVGSEEPADAIVKFLTSYNWQAKRYWLLDEKGALLHDPNIVPDDGLRIRVGLYPAIPFVTPEGEKNMQQRLRSPNRRGTT